MPARDFREKRRVRYGWRIHDGPKVGIVFKNHGVHEIHRDGFENCLVRIMFVNVVGTIAGFAYRAWKQGLFLEIDPPDTFVADPFSDDGRRKEVFDLEILAMTLFLARCLIRSAILALCSRWSCLLLAGLGRVRSFVMGFTILRIPGR